MLTYSGARALFGKFTNNDGATNLSLGDTLINEHIRRVLSIMPWPFMEKERTAVTVAGQQYYNLPADCDKIISDFITVGSYQYRPKQITSFNDWNFVNSPTGVQGNFTSYYFIKERTIGFWPVPSSSDLTITYDYSKIVRDIVSADYTTGTITTATAGSTTITGSGSSWTSQMAGKYIRITSSNSTNTGDGLWYLISSVSSATSLTLEDPYLGNNIAAGSAAYTIGDCMVIPERFQIAPVYGAVADYWRMSGDLARSNHFEGMYDKMIQEMKEYEGRKSTDAVIDDMDPYNYINPNLNPILS